MTEYEYVYGQGNRDIAYLNEMGAQGWKFLGDYALGLLFMREKVDTISYRGDPGVDWLDGKPHPITYRDTNDASRRA